MLYAVKDKLGKGEDLVPGTMLDLKFMQEAGEESNNVPVSDEEMKSVVESVYGELPLLCAMRAGLKKTPYILNSVTRGLIIETP